MRYEHSYGFAGISGQIPLEARQSLGIEPGQEVQIIQYEDRLELIPLRPIPRARGIDTDIEREDDRV